MPEGSALVLVDLQIGAFGDCGILVAGIQSEHCVAATCRGALRLGYGVHLADDGHGTWPDGTRSAPEISAAQNEALEGEGVALSSTARLVEWLRS